MPSIPVMEEPLMVESNQALADIARQWQCSSMLAVDTEFIRTDTFYAILGLIQVSDGSGCWLIDPLTITDWQPLKNLLQDQRIIKVFHAPSEDLEVLNQTIGCLPQPLFDTQVAAALAGFGFSRGYSALVKVLLDIELEKHETRSDWTRRPLSETQKAYAAEDVHYLAMIYPMLEQRLQALGRSQWLVDDMQLLADKASEPDCTELYYLKVKSAWHLKPAGVALLQRLCMWREQEARLRDKPRSRIVSDKVLLEVALHWPANMNELSVLHDMHPRVLRMYGSKLLSLVVECRSLSESSYPELLPQPLPRECGVALKRLRKN